MVGNTGEFYVLLRGVVIRRKVFLYQPNTRKLIYPTRGQIWEPSPKDEAMCDAFIFFVVSELEEYFESVLIKSVFLYEDIFKSHVVRNCRASNDFMPAMSKKRAELERNNNANWSRISHFFDFIGMKKDVHFPQDFWDDIEGIVKHRGDLAHNGLSLAIVEDRRNVIHKIELSIGRLRVFDQQFNVWMKAMEAELLRLKAIDLSFSPNYQ